MSSDAENHAPTGRPVGTPCDEAASGGAVDLTDSGDDGKWLRTLLDSVRKRKGMHGGIGFTLDEASLMLAISLGKTASWEARLRDQMGAAVQSGALKLRDAETGLVLPDHLQVADDWGRVTPADVSKWLQDQGVEYLWDDPEQANQFAAQSVEPMEADLQASNAEMVSDAGDVSVNESAADRRARLLRWHEDEVKAAGKRGALARVSRREKQRRPTADRANIGRDIRKAREEREAARKGGEFARLLP